MRPLKQRTHRNTRTHRHARTNRRKLPQWATDVGLPIGYASVTGGMSEGQVAVHFHARTNRRKLPQWAPDVGLPIGYASVTGGMSEGQVAVHFPARAGAGQVFKGSRADRLPSQAASAPGPPRLISPQFR